MIALALETSGRVGSVALSRDGEVIDARTYPHGLMHATAIVPLIDELFRSHDLTPADLDHIYVSIGPGSFTGLRVGVTLAKTLAFSTGAKLVAVPSVSVLVENAPADATHAAVVLDAKRGQIFTASFDRNEVGDWVEREPARLDRLSDVVSRSPKPLHLLGDGLPFHRASIDNAEGIIFTDQSVWQAQARTVARLGSRLAAAGAFVEPFALEPVYVRLAEAEEKRLAALGEP